MAVRTWANALGIAVGAGALAGAGQLGIGYGLGILRFDQDFPTGAPWAAQLAWVTFLASAAVIGGTLAGAWHARRLAVAPTPAVRAALAVAAAVGATVMIPLLVRPAGATHLAESGNPRVAVALAAAAGLLAGVVAAYAVLAFPAVSGNVITYVLWLWVAGLVSAAWTLGQGASWGTARLGLLPGTGAWVPVVLLLPPALIALAVAAIARFGGSDKRAVAASGVAGPLLLGFAYLVSGPSSGSQSTAYRYALIAVAAGLAVSVLVGVVRRPTRKPPPEPAPAPAPAPDAPEPDEATELSSSTVPASIRSAPETTPVSLWPDAPQAGDLTDEDAEAPTGRTRSRGRTRTPAEPATGKAERPRATAAARPVSPAPAALTETRETRPAGSAVSAGTQQSNETAKLTESPKPTKAKRSAGTAKPAQTPEPPAEPADAPPAQSSRRRRSKAPEPAPAIPAETPETPEPAEGTTDVAAKSGRGFRLGRRDRGRTDAPTGAKKGAPGDGYEDWVKGLGAEPPVPVDNGKPARHAQSGEEGAQPANGNARSRRS